MVEFRVILKFSKLFNTCKSYSIELVVFQKKSVLQHEKKNIIRVGYAVHMYCKSI